MSAGWRTLLLRIGDRCPEYGGSADHKEHIETCYGVLYREYEHSKDAMFEFLLQCAEQLPHKIPFFGVLIGLVNLENEDFAKGIVDTTQANLQDAMHNENRDRIRILLRFLSGLMCSKVVLPNCIIETYETLLSAAATILDEETGNPSWQPRADFYVYCILASLPWGGPELFEQLPDEFGRVLVGIQSYISIRRHFDDIAFSVFETDEGNSPNKKDFMEDLWERIQVLSRNGWKVKSVPQPHLLFEAQLVAGKSHRFSPISCPPPTLSQSSSEILKGQEKHEADLKYPQRLRRLHIFPTNKAESMQPVDRFVVEECILDVLLFFNGCRKECAFYLVSLPVPFRYEYLMAETIFSQLLSKWSSVTWDTYKDDSVGTTQFVKEKILNDVWWGNVKHLIEFTDPIYSMLREVDTDKSCLHLVYEMWDSMIEKVKDVIYKWEGKEPHEDCFFYSVIHSILVDRWGKSNTPLHCLAHSLNPRYYGRYYAEAWIQGGPNRQFPHDDNEINKNVLKCLRKSFPITEIYRKLKAQFAGFSQFGEGFDSFESIEDRAHLKPKQWWSMHGGSAPELRALALKLLGQPSSSYCCERNWSTYGFIHSMKRNKMTPQRAEDLVFVHTNLRLLSRKSEKYHHGPTRMWDVGADAHESFTSGVGILEIANLSLDEPELEMELCEDATRDDDAETTMDECDE